MNQHANLNVPADATAARPVPPPVDAAAELVERAAFDAALRVRPGETGLAWLAARFARQRFVDSGGQTSNHHPITSPEHWARRVAKRFILMDERPSARYDRRARRLDPAFDLPLAASDPFDPPAAAQDAERLALTEKAIALILAHIADRFPTPALRQALEAYYLHGADGHTAANIAGMTRNAFQLRVHRLNHALHDHLVRHLSTDQLTYFAAAHPPA